METTELIGLDWAAFRAGISRRQLDYWIRNKVYEPAVPARGSGSRIQIKVADIPKLRLLGRIADAFDENKQRLADSIRRQGEVASQLEAVEEEWMLLQEEIEAVEREHAA